MKILTRNYLIFVTICILLFAFLFFNEYYYTINLYDTYYHISYFFFVLPIYIIGTIFLFSEDFNRKIKKRSSGIFR